jgi:hypothetical protein
MTGIRLLLYIFLVVISNPYEGLDYNKINVYDLNYCSGSYCSDSDPNYYHDLFREEEEENFEEEEQEEENEKPLIFSVDFNEQD